MIHIDTSGLTPSDKWNTRAGELTQKLQDAKTKAERDAIIDNNYQWRVFKEELKKLSYGKCWYSEAREIYSHYHVDHFRPKKRALDDSNDDKGGYWWLTYDWTNYRLCGSVGNTKKSDYFPVRRHKANAPSDPLDDEVFYFLDPTDADDVKLLNFDAEGRAIPANPDSHTWEYMRASETIKWFDLNYAELRAERQRVWIRVSGEIEIIELLNQKQNTNPTSATQALIKAELRRLRQLIAPCTELSATIRCCIRVSGYPWALRLLEEPVRAEVFCKEYLP